MVSPSEEDSQTFTVSAANGEVYKLRGKEVKPTVLTLVLPLDIIVQL